MTARSPDTLAVAFPSHRLRAMTGSLELSLAQVVWSGASRPVRVGRVLELMFDRISGRTVTPERIRHLASSAREWLLQRAALRIWSDSGWFEAQCGACSERFDLPISLASTPTKPASSSFPLIEVETSIGRRAFEAPNGEHEEKLAEAPSASSDSIRFLLGLCGLDKTASRDAQRFTPADLDSIESAFEDSCPDLADQVRTRCPSCATEIDVYIDPLQFAFPRPQALLKEIHLIASTYHWSESDILSMPSMRRSAYAGLIRSELNQGLSR